MPDELLSRLQRFHADAFPADRPTFQSLVDQGQHPTTLFIGCSDSRVVPYLLTAAGPGGAPDSLIPTPGPVHAGFFTPLP